MASQRDGQSVGEDDGLRMASLRADLPAALQSVLDESAAQGFLGGMAMAEQIDHALGFVMVAERMMGRAPSSVVDLGTGGGVPGLILALCWPSSRVVLVDGSVRRTEFLTMALSRFSGIDHATVITGRAEELGHRDELREAHEVVTARSFGSPSVTAECGAALMAEGALMVVSEPPDTEGQDRWPSEGLQRCNLQAEETLRIDGRFGYQVLRKEGTLPERLPRRVGIPAKRPLF